MMLANADTVPNSLGPTLSITVRDLLSNSQQLHHLVQRRYATSPSDLTASLSLDLDTVKARGKRRAASQPVENTTAGGPGEKPENCASPQ